MIFNDTSLNIPGARPIKRFGNLCNHELLQWKPDRIANAINEAKAAGSPLVFNTEVRGPLYNGKLQILPFDAVYASLFRTRTPEYASATDDAIIEESIDFLMEGVKIANDIDPGIKVAFYNAGFNQWWPPVYREIAKDPDGSTKQWAIDKYNQWRDEIGRLKYSREGGSATHRGLIDAVDFICPVGYTIWRPEELDQWRFYIDAHVDIIHDMQKEAWTYITPRYIGTLVHPTITGIDTPIEPDYFRSMLEHLLIRSDHVIVWLDTSAADPAPYAEHLTIIGEYV